MAPRMDVATATMAAQRTNPQTCRQSWRCSRTASSREVSWSSPRSVMAETKANVVNAKE
jgi:hypothetical protein